MKIQEIKLNNIGPYSGENIFSFKIDNSDENIVLVGGKNGAGKTTLFDAMRFCLYGYKLYGYRQNSQSYMGKIKKLINDRVKKNITSHAGITLTIHIDDGYTNSVFTILREWTLQGNRINESYNVYRDKILLSDEERIDFDNYLLQTIPPALFNFHFFNGENISDFLFDKENGQLFRKAFMQICGLDTLDLIQEQLQNSIRTHSEGKDSEVQDEYNKRKSYKEQFEIELTEVITELNKIEEEINYLEEKSALLENEMVQFGGIHYQELAIIQEKIKVEDSFREEKRKYLKDCANHILPFLILKKELSELEKQIQIETHISSNRAIKERLFKNETKKELEKKIAQYLQTSLDQDSDNFFESLYDAIKYDSPEESKEYLKLSENERAHLLAKIDTYLAFDIKEIEKVEKAIKASLTKQKRLRSQVDFKEVLDSESYLNKKNELLMQIDQCRKQQIEFTLTKTEIGEELKVAEQEFDKISEILKSILKEKSVKDISARATLAFDELKQNLYSKYISMVESAFIRNFNQLIIKTNLLDGIYISNEFEVVPYKVSKIDVKKIEEMTDEYGLEYVKEQLGERAFKILKENDIQKRWVELPVKIDQHFSAGEQQIFVMALYQALSEIRISEIPFVIDTPLARIDSGHRKNILDNFLSKLPGQVIILSTDEEIDASGVEILKQKLSDTYLIEHQADETTKILHNQYFKEVSN